jgi:mannose-6-phosphate isomerase-like protein (cupin superfamily)
MQPTAALRPLRSGDVLENPVTGERLRFRQTAAETGGELTAFAVTVRPGGGVKVRHRHPRQIERFAVVAGHVELELAGEVLTLGPGAAVTVPAGVAHRFVNRGDADLCMDVEVRPALGFEQFVRTHFALAEHGLVDRRGVPSLLRAAVIGRAHRDDAVLAGPPVWLQRLGLALLAPLGRLRGYRATYAADVAAAPR